MKRSLQSKLTRSIALFAMLLIATVSLLSVYFINERFNAYVSKQQQAKLSEIVYAVGQGYSAETGTWDVNVVHGMGMIALVDGYIIRVSDKADQTVWDAEIWDMSTCLQIKEDISHQMLSRYPWIKGEFVDRSFEIEQQGLPIGRVNISYFGPYFYSENDFDFIAQLSSILLGIAVVSLGLSLVMGVFMARQLSYPILKTISATQNIARGDYSFQLRDSSKVEELDRLIESVNHLASTLQKQEQLKRQLTSDVAHELRTPLTTLRITMEAMVDGLIEPTRERLMSSHEELQRITSIVNDLERLATIEDGNLKLSMHEVDLGVVIRRCVDQCGPLIDGKTMNVNVSGHAPIIMADEERLTQVVINLLTNAIKYTPEKGDIDIRIYEDADDVRFEVKDNGYGIPEAEIPFIFERFYRADKSRNRATGGSGIGLAIVKSIVEAHHGSVDVTSVLGSGSTFIVRLPKK
jgi:signal transduction histidine kinase